MTNSAEYRVLRVKPRAARLLWPTLALAALSFTLAFLAEQISPSDYNIALIIGSAAALFLWFFPLLSYLFSYLELTNERLIYRFGFMGLRKRELLLANLSSIEIQKAGRLGQRTISILTLDGSELAVDGYAKTKLLAAELEALAKATI